jgi:hypothetical protein
MLLTIVMDRKTGVEGRPARLEDAAELIARFARRSERVMTGAWLVETSEGINDWTTRLQTVCEGDDRLLVAELRSYVGGMLPAGLWPWINTRTMTLLTDGR